MTDFTYLQTAQAEYEVLDREIAVLESMSGNNPNIKSLIAKIHGIQSEIKERADGLLKELEAIKAIDPEMYRLIYWHDAKGLPFRSCFAKAFPDLWSDDPENYCRVKYWRFMKKYKQPAQNARQ